MLVDSICIYILYICNMYEFENKVGTMKQRERDKQSCVLER